MTVLNYAAARERLNWWGWSTLVAAIPLFHFAASVALWLFWWGASPRRHSLLSHFRELASRDFLCFAPALCLLALSATAFRLALKSRRDVWRLLLLIALSAAAFFWVDVHFHRYQMHTFIATEEYWDNGGRVYTYITWWWYNDGWFR